MCGICGVWGDDDTDAVQHMMRLQRQRGPDAEGEYVSDTGRLGHNRLSIMDVEGGNQPLFSEDRTRAIIANGEIYNHAALRADLEYRHSFATDSDTEVVVHLYEDEGTGTAEMLDGMFAFAIADGDDIYLARDPVGIKPLYYGKRSGSTIFASELKALAGVAENVREFPPGHWFHSQSGFHQYYDVPNLDPLKSSDEEHAARVRQVLERSVVKRLMSDVPLGSFLSGGLDSSAAASIASRHIDGLNTFAVGIEGSRDLEAARVAAKFIGSKHHEYLVTKKEVASCLPEIVYSLESFDMDLVRSAVPCYFASRLAAEYVKVIFTGEGADELFAGYTYQKDITDEDALRAELRRSIQGLHNTNLQRVDRLTMAHGIEARVPFLDVKMIEEAQKVPARLKLRDGIEKWVLRKACEDLLPSAILWRKKEQFDEGSGLAEVLPEITKLWVKPDEVVAYREASPGVRLRSHEECAYHKLLVDAYPENEAILVNVAHWSDRPELG